MRFEVLVKWLMVVFIFFIPEFLQGQHIQWTSVFEGQGTSRPTDICTDVFGNVFVLGSFQDTVDFNAGTASQQFVSTGHRNLFLVKYDSSGQMLWARQFKGSQDVQGNKMVCDNAGSVYITAQFRGVIDANPGVGVSNFYTGANDSTDIILIKLNAGGNLLWVKQFIGSEDEAVTDIVVNTSNELILSVYLTDSMDVNPGTAVQLCTTDSTRMKTLVLRLNSNGNYLSSFALQHAAIRAGIDFSKIQTLCVTSTNEIVVAGNFLGQVDLDTGAGQQFINQQGDSSAIFVAAYSNAGQLLWSQQIGALNTRCHVNDMSYSSNQHFYLTGSFQSTIDFDAGSGQSLLSSFSANDDAFILKLIQQGQFDWVRQLGGMGVDEGMAITIKPNEYVVVAGNFSDYVDFGMNTNSDWHQSYGGVDGFVVTLNANGIYHEGEQCGGVGDDVSTGLCQDNVNSVYTAGDFFQTCHFTTSLDSVIENANSQEVFFQRLTSCFPIQTAITLSGCHDTVNGMVYNQSGVYYQYYAASNGCDSILKINYTSLQHDSILFLNECNAIQVNGQLLDTTGVYLQQWTNVAGCDSSLEIHFTRYWPQDSFLTITTCDSVEYNGVWYAQSGQINQLYTSVQGCDSIFHLTIVIHSSANNYLQDTACVSYVLNGQTYSASGNYVQLYQTVEGCDSNIHLQLVILEPDSNSMNVIECGSYTLNGQTYTQSGNYQQIFQNSQGCDSVLMLNLQLLETWSQQVIVTSCDSFQFNGISYTHGGAYQQHYTKTNGCDSTYYLSLTLLSANDSVTTQGATLHAYISGAIYQWLECPSMQPVPGAVYQHFNPTKNGDYALAIEDLGCKDTSACFTLTDVGVGDFDVPSIEIFPNPTHDILHLKGETDGDTASIVLLDITGHVMECQTQQNGNELDIHVSHLSVGLYYLRIIYQGRSFVYKWMKE